MTVYYDLVRVYCTTVGTGGPLTLSGAVSFAGGTEAFRSFANAAVPDGTTVSWAIEDLGVPGREAGFGTYSASAGTLTRNTTSSTNGGNPLSLSGQAQLYVTALAADIANAGNISSGTLAEARIAQLDLTTSGGGNGTVVQRLYTGTSNPGSSNDTTQGYAAGSYGLNTGTGQGFVCRSAASGAAVWEALGVPDHPGLTNENGAWFLSVNSGVSAGAVAANGTASFTPFMLKTRCTIKALGCCISTAGSSNLQLAIYSSAVDSSGLQRPNALVASTGNISNSSTGFVSGSVTSVQLEPGLYWFAWNSNDSTCKVIGPGNAIGQYLWLVGSTSSGPMLSGGTVVNRITLALTFGTWTTPLGGSSFSEQTTVGAVGGCIQISSVP